MGYGDWEADWVGWGHAHSSLSGGWVARLLGVLGRFEGWGTEAMQTTFVPQSPWLGQVAEWSMQKPDERLRTFVVYPHPAGAPPGPQLDLALGANCRVYIGPFT